MVMLVASWEKPVVDGTPENDRIEGSQYKDTLRGFAGHDLLLGGAGADVLDGGDGADTLDGGVGADTLIGGAGADLFMLQINNEGIDIIMDFDPDEDQFAFKEGLDLSRFEFQPGLDAHAGHTWVIDTLTGETIALILGKITAGPTVVTPLDTPMETPTADPEVLSNLMWVVADRPADLAPNSPLSATSVAIVSPNPPTGGEFPPPPAEDPPPPPAEDPPPLDLTGRLLASSSVAGYLPGGLIEPPLGPSQGAWSAILDYGPGWGAEVDNWTLTEENGRLFVEFSYGYMTFGEVVRLEIDPADFSGWGFANRVQFVEDEGTPGTVQVDFAQGGYERSLLIFGDFVGSIVVDYTYAEPRTEPITNPMLAEIQPPTDRSATGVFFPEGDTYNGGTWDIFEPTATGWLGIDTDFKIATLDQDDFFFGYGEQLFLEFPLNSPAVGDRAEIRFDRSTFEPFVFDDWRFVDSGTQSATASTLTATMLGSVVASGGPPLADPLDITFV